MLLPRKQLRLAECVLQSMGEEEIGGPGEWDRAHGDGKKRTCCSLMVLATMAIGATKRGFGGGVESLAAHSRPLTEDLTGFYFYMYTTHV